MTTRRKIVSQDSAPEPLVLLHEGRLMPATPYDAQRMQDFANGTEFDLKVRRQRSLRQLRNYWGVLRAVIEATDQWPSERHLHNDLKLSLGYTHMGFDLMTKRAIRVADSIDFETMPQDEFNTYFKKAMALLSRHLGYDPMTIAREGRR